MRVVSLGLLLCGLGGCIIVDKDVHDGPGPDPAWDTGWDDPPSPDAVSWWFDPDTVGRGEVATLMLRASPDYPYWDVEAVRAVGDVSVCGIERRPGGVLVTVSVAKDAADGPADAIVVNSAGESAYLEDALLIKGEGEGDGSTCD